MQSENRDRHTLSIEKKRGSLSRKNTAGVVNALVFNAPDLSFYLKLQNLLNYCIDCINALATLREQQTVSAEHLNRCISHLAQLEQESSATGNSELTTAMVEFLDDAHQFEKLLNTYAAPHLEQAPNQTGSVLLTAKASHLQWLSVCILEELKKSYNHI